MPRQCVGHHVVLPRDVPDVPCEFRHVAEVAALTGGPRLRRLGEGERERLVVRVQREPPPLQHEAEVPDALYAGQQHPIVGGIADLCCVPRLIRGPISGSNHLPKWDEYPLGTRTRFVNTCQFFHVGGLDVAPTTKNWFEPIIKCREITLGPQIHVSLTSYKILPL